MKKTKIGQTDLEVAPLNLGGNVFGWTLDEKGSFEILDGFVEGGYNFIDTADMYSYWINGGAGGESETIIGQWMKERANRDQIILATKGGGPTGVQEIDNSKAHMIKSVDQSLKRLQTDYIDLYYTHYDDEKTPVEETLEAYAEVIKAGKVRHIAVSNMSPERIQTSFEASEKLGLPKFQALQPLYNLVERSGYEEHYAPIAEKYGLSVYPYASLAQGFLSGKYRSEADLGKSVRGGGLKKYLEGNGLFVLDALDQVAKKHNASPTTVSLAWLLAQPHVDAPIVSATSKEQLHSLLAAPKLVLDQEDLNLLDKASK